jgi:hypothetical protein
MNAAEMCLAVLVAAIVGAVAVPLALDLFGVGGWPTQRPVATGFAAGLTIYHLGILTVIARNSDR